MKKIIILPFLFLATLSWGQAQFVVQNGTKTEVYNNINTAITNAVAGDTLYIPGGGFTITNTTIDKTLHWVGHGHYPSETGATMQTRINSALNFTGNCDNSSFEGIFFTSEVSFGSADNEAENILMKRCRVLSNLSLRTVTTGNPDLNFQISECVLYTLFGNYGINCLIEKSLIFNRIHYFVQSQFSHNSINVSSSNRVIYLCTSCIFVDNVFGYEGGLYNSFSCVINNNVFAGSLPFTPVTDINGNDGFNNIYNVGSANVYSDVSQSVNPYTFAYENDYTLKGGSTGTDQSGASGISISGTATDGTNAGIYGTATPYKTIPYYPHINTANIATQAVNNELGIDINAEAQSR
ncbi:hypothetical protein SAMN05444285_10984 [Draconibacterium orientale]|uniref:Pectate lyase superfamily protein n=1 Tax=Draconibacterium orientale TaxID=1168034 RepID=X5E541_9BACT|nr:hypothetical protein [Draconibacterium orientale]AHW61731.1 hypothetical protein FH5T_07235 [Draconibacterium orientale]SET28548.1 hypothetical protein SAMN05444285_10984 [Draconibacterium orientale]